MAQVQLEIYNNLLPRAKEPGEVGAKVQMLSKTLLNITEVCMLSIVLENDTESILQLYQLYAEPFDLPIMKLLIFHVSGHRDENMIRPIWNKIFQDGKPLL